MKTHFFLSSWKHKCVHLFLISFSQRGKNTSFLINCNNTLTCTEDLRCSFYSRFFLTYFLYPTTTSPCLSPVCLHWNSSEWKSWHAWSLRTYIQSSPAHEVSDSHETRWSTPCSRFSQRKRIHLIRLSNHKNKPKMLIVMHLKQKSMRLKIHTNKSIV